MQVKEAQIQQRKCAKQSQGQSSVRVTSHPGFDLVFYTPPLAVAAG